MQLHTEYSTRLLQADEDRFQLVREHPKGPRRGWGGDWEVIFLVVFSTGSSCFGPQFLFPQTRKGPIEVQSYRGAFIDHNMMTAYQKAIAWGLAVNSGSQWVNTCNV